jgi:hypothetical protein
VRPPSRVLRRRRALYIDADCAHNCYDHCHIFKHFVQSTSSVGGVGAAAVLGAFAAATTGTFTFTPTTATPSVFYYQCALHAYMGARIDVVDAGVTGEIDGGA